jgi:pyridinium-3,5-biscarboxylic acid mononucleotide synthase
MKRTVKDHCAEPGRYERQGFPEAVYCPGKTVEQIMRITRELLKGAGPVLLTRIEKSDARKIVKKLPRARYSETARMIILDGTAVRKAGSSCIAVVTAGTTDISAAEEAALTAEVMGNRVERLYDVGVAGVHRLLKHDELLRKASCIIVCAGMEGALASVVGGLARCPVIGVPTSVGYGASFGGVAALLAMLNSCAANVCTVNIDDGFGAGVIASLINKRDPGMVHS